MSGALHVYLNAPIPRKQALGAFMIYGVTIATELFIIKAQSEVITDQHMRLKICNEIMDFLLDKADIETVKELDEKLEYWRIIRGMPRES